MKIERLFFFNNRSISFVSQSLTNQLTIQKNKNLLIHKYVNILLAKKLIKTTRSEYKLAIELINI